MMSAAARAPSRNARAIWGVIAAVIALDAAGLAHCGIRLALPGLLRVGGAMLAFTALGFVYERWRPEERLAELARSATRLLAVFAAMGVFSYLVATTDLPVDDALLARADRALGLDWLAWFAVVQQHPMFHALLHVAYFTALLQIAIITVYLGLTGQPERNSELLWTMMISLLIIVPLSGLLPAFSATVYYGVPGLRDHMADLVALRSGRFAELDLARLQGLITFPSFHTTLGILFPYALRRRPVALAIGLLVNGAMLASVPTEGSHYFVDMMGGAAVAVIAIVAATAIEARLARRPAPAVLAVADAD